MLASSLGLNDSAAAIPQRRPAIPKSIVEAWNDSFCWWKPVRRDAAEDARATLALHAQTTLCGRITFMREDINSLTPLPVDENRRSFLVTKLTAGFALAVQPVSAQTITTDTNGIVAGEVKIPVSGGEIPAYRAMPATGSKFPVTLVVQEIFGVHEHIKDICRRFAKLGHVAIAPEMYARQGDVSKVPDSQVMSDLDAAVAYAAKSAKCDISKLGITGFCWGGRVVWLYAAHNPKVKAGVAWYGRLVGQPSANTPKHPVDIAAQLQAPILGLYGADDQGIPQDTVEKMREALKDGGKSGEIVMYPKTQQGFSADGWKRMQAWFKKYGAA